MFFVHATSAAGRSPLYKSWVIHWYHNWYCQEKIYSYVFQDVCEWLPLNAMQRNINLNLIDEWLNALRQFEPSFRWLNAEEHEKHQDVNGYYISLSWRYVESRGNPLTAPFCGLLGCTGNDDDTFIGVSKVIAVVEVGWSAVTSGSDTTTCDARTRGWSCSSVYIIDNDFSWPEKWVPWISIDGGIVGTTDKVSLSPLTGTFTCSRADS